MKIRANTATDVLIGPFVDKTDGNTTEDGLTLTAAEIKLSKNGQALTLKNDATAATFDDDGYYNCELNATDTDTEGNLVLIVHQSANALPVRHEYDVLSEAAWDSLFAAKDSGVMDVHVKTMEAGVITATVIAADAIDADSLKADGSVQIAAAVWDRILSGATHNIQNSAGKRLRQIDAAFEVHSGTAQAGSTSTTIKLDTGASTTNDIYRGDRIIIVGGTGVEEHGICVSYVGSTRVATMAEAWVITPDNTSEFEVVPATVDVETIQHTVQTAGDLAALLATAAADLLDKLGAVNEVAAAGDPSATESVMQYVKQIINILTGSAGIVAMPAAAAPANAVSIAEMIRAIYDDTNAGATAAALGVVDGIVDNILLDTAQMNLGIVVSTTKAGTLTTTACSTNLSEATNDHYIGRILTWTSGVLDGQTTDITDYVGTNGVLTYTALTEAPGDGDAFKIT